MSGPTSAGLSESSLHDAFGHFPHVGVAVAAEVGGTQKLLSNMVLAFLTHPDQYRMLRDDPSRTPAGDWWHRDSGTVGMLDLLRLGQPRRGTLPWQSRGVRHHSRHHGCRRLGHGLHRCLGAPLATLEATVVLEQLVQNFVELDWDPTRAVHDPSFFIRGLNGLPIRAVADRRAPVR